MASTTRRVLLMRDNLASVHGQTENSPSELAAGGAVLAGMTCPTTALPLPSVVVWLVADDRQRSVDLLAEDQARQPVRQRQRRQRQAQTGARHQRGWQAVGAADREGQAARAAGHPIFELLREPRRAPALPPRLERDGLPLRRPAPRQRPIIFDLHHLH